MWKVEKKKNKNNYALKVMSKAKHFIFKKRIINKKSVHSVMNERILLSNLTHPFLINMIDAF